MRPWTRSSCSLSLRLEEGNLRSALLVHCTSMLCSIQNCSSVFSPIRVRECKAKSYPSWSQRFRLDHVEIRQQCMSKLWQAYTELWLLEDLELHDCCCLFWSCFLPLVQLFLLLVGACFSCIMSLGVLTDAMYWLCNSCSSCLCCRLLAERQTTFCELGLRAVLPGMKCKRHMKHMQWCTCPGVGHLVFFCPWNIYLSSCWPLSLSGRVILYSDNSYICTSRLGCWHYMASLLACHDMSQMVSSPCLKVDERKPKKQDLPGK